jgi:hypothetical protein
LFRSRTFFGDFLSLKIRFISIPSKHFKVTIQLGNTHSEDERMVVKLLSSFLVLLLSAGILSAPGHMHSSSVFSSSSVGKAIFTLAKFEDNIVRNIATIDM